MNGALRAVQAPRCFMVLIFSLLAGCASAPPPAPPRAALRFERVVPERIDAVVLQYQCTVENSRSIPLHIEITGWTCLLNGKALAPASVELTRAGTNAAGTRITVEPLASAGEPIILRLDPASLPVPSGAKSTNEYHASLALELRVRYGDEPPVTTRIAANASLPQIRPPEFTITTIAILQADLINTRFRVGMRIDNPNPFPLNLSAFEYQLYGGGIFWAEGGKEDILPVPATGSAETSLSLEMNFIGMPRRLLDEIVSMREVDYRFTGTVDVAAALTRLPQFRIPFDRQGRSAVLK